MHCVFVGVLLGLLALVSARHPKNNDQCTFYQNGCTYQVSIHSSECNLVGDDPALIIKNIVNEDKKELKEAKKKETVEIPKEELKTIEDMEKKLVKLVEGLSVRSLRHIRQIRNDLRQMTSSISMLKQQGGNGKKSKRGLTCPAEFISVGTWTSCYRFSNFNTTWHEAREYCNAFGADLIALDTLKESYILDYLIKSNPEFEVPKGFWTSGNYIARNQKWMWTTKHHLRPMQFSRWAPGEPDARSTMHCMLLYKYADYRWHDAVCTDKHHFICEINL